MGNFLCCDTCESEHMADRDCYTQYNGYPYCDNRDMSHNDTRDSILHHPPYIPQSYNPPYNPPYNPQSYNSPYNPQY